MTGELPRAYPKIPSTPRARGYEEMLVVLDDMTGGERRSEQQQLRRSETVQICKLYIRAVRSYPTFLVGGMTAVNFEISTGHEAACFTEKEENRTAVLVGSG